MHTTVSVYGTYRQLLPPVAESEYAPASTNAFHLLTAVQKKWNIPKHLSRVRASSHIHKTLILNENDDSW
jgi:hypothetical protein